MFKRKVYEKLIDWKNEWNGKYACLLEGARRVGKTTIAEELARNEYESDIGLFTTMLFNDSEHGIADIYRKLLSDKLK